jgi:Fe-Mn family superoxide dismutase
VAEQLSKKPLKNKEIPGILSEKQLSDHYTLYEGYVNKTNEIWQAYETVDRSKANQTYSAFRALKSEESFALNGVKLHEAYFYNMGGKGGRPTGKIAELIERDFGSFEKWEEDFKASAIAARGWVVLAYDLDDHRLHNYSQDAHNVGAIWAAVPLLVIDTYEHAYTIDYGVRRPPYIDNFMKTIDWDEVNARLEKYKLV